MTPPPEIPQSLRMLMAEIGPKWGSDTKHHIKLMIDGFSEVLKNAPTDGVRVDFEVVYGAHERQRFEVFHPPAGTTTRDALIFVHGGAFTEGSRSRTAQIYSNILYYFARHGILGINAGYRLAPDATYPEASRDIGAIVAWTRAHADELGIDAARIFLMGHSAGGAHAAAYAYDKRLQPQGGPGIAGLIVVSGRVRADNRPDNPNARRVEAYYGTDATLFEGLSALSSVDAASPPTFIAMAEFENPLIDIYCLELAHRIAMVKGHAPPLKWMRGHNHTSIIGHFNTAEDELGTAIRTFVADIVAARAPERVLVVPQ